MWTMAEMKVSIKTKQNNLLWARWVDKTLEILKVLSNIVCW